MPKTPEGLEPNIHLIVFKPFGNTEYGVRIEQVREVTVTPPIVRMPQTPPYIMGVANIRGNIIAVLDLEELFNIPAPSSANNNAQTYTLVIEAENYNVGLLVRDVPQSVSIPVSKIDRTPGLIENTGMNTSFIESIAKLDERMIIVLNILKILSIKMKEELAAVTAE
jgi:purine-binding chemotaxis protein CheW